MEITIAPAYKIVVKYKRNNLGLAKDLPPRKHLINIKVIINYNIYYISLCITKQSLHYGRKN